MNPFIASIVFFLASAASMTVSADRPALLRAQDPSLASLSAGKDVYPEPMTAEEAKRAMLEIANYFDPFGSYSFSTSFSMMSMSFSFPIQDYPFDDKDGVTTTTPTPTRPQADDVAGTDTAVPVSENNDAESEESDGIAPNGLEGTVRAGGASSDGKSIAPPLVSGLAALAVAAVLVVGFRKYRASRHGSGSSMLLSESSEDPSLASTA